MSAYARDIKDSLTFFVFVAMTALCLSFTFSVFVYQIGMLDDPRRFLVANLVVAACVAIPTATIASQHEFQLKRYQRQLESLASTDPLTGLLNRRFFRISAEDEIHRQKRAGGMAAVVLFDLDQFKRVNDLHGHQAGDAILKRIAEIAYSELRGPFDKLGRWGGEEFVVLLSQVNRDQAWLVCDRLRERLEHAEIEYNGKSLSITASFGFEMLSGDASLDRVLEAADRALYVSKTTGRNRVTYAGPRLAVSA
ncbi:MULTISPECIES: GGDEF domain-containing protein [Hyphomonas]|uniref:diguanylate cyclase n=2 Tax=Hyphomonas adhaerens TaxID=81029 RepID=A0A069E5C0_9PROT|nr:MULTISPECIES: GGDEF domain-containing protein [Hyphomonas]KCZ82742.1 diguanylate cyclase [Hyphomonas adhaerens MHS-3]MBB41021.1 GGDEF domain-containing protein [Hyphomonas sp.]HAE27952.1 GGDEF domain-containing protein [Hyphomonas adhaerens]|tara:strand:- start:972 stop:1727 length:756 start_codon:yes stop_codon:yes gene_type:complete